MKNPQSAMSFFKNLSDGLNHVEYPLEQYAPSYFDRNIVEMAFFHNLILIRKGANNEQSNAPDLLKREMKASQDVSSITLPM